MKNNLNKLVFSLIMIQLAAVLVLFHILEHNYLPLGIVKYTVILSIFITSFFAPKNSPEHKLTGYAIAFLLIGDTFFILIGLIPGCSPESPLAKTGGMLGFFAAYGILSYLFSRNFSLGRQDFFKLIPVLIVISPVAYIIIPYLQGVQLAGALVFALLLSFMAWSGLCTLHRGYFKRSVAMKFALAGFLMFASDMGVTFSLFYPGLTRQDPWLGNFIWITYIPGWTLLLLTLFETNLICEKNRIS